MMNRYLTAIVVCWISIFISFQFNSLVEAKGKEYKDSEDVPLIANRVGPFANPSEIYSYYSLPFCRPVELQHQSQDLGELLSGDRKVRSLYEIGFKVDIPWRRLDRKKLTDDEIKLFETAVDEEYYFEMFLDNLPIWGYVGDSDKETDLILSGSGFAVPEPHKFVYTHLHFNIAYNGQNVIEVNVTANPAYRFDITNALEIIESEKGSGDDSLFNPLNKMIRGNNQQSDDPSKPDYRTADFSYSVKWIPTNIPYESRMERYHKMHFLQASYQIHWLSIINSFVLVLLLTVFLAVILMRVLKNDFSRYMRTDDEEDAVGEEESGWKLIHGDVFRFPAYKMLFTAMLGAGSQLFFMSLGVLVLALINTFTTGTKRGSLLAAMVVFYALTASIGGYVSGRFYRQLGGTNWVWNTILCAILFPGPLFAVFAFVNTVAFSHGSTAALPIGTIFVVIAVYALITFPLTVVGAIVGKNSTTDFEAPCRTSKVPRPIPPSPWYRQSFLQYFMAGFLPFSSIYIEIHYIFASVWGHRVYTLFGVLFLAFILLLLVTSFITVALTYFQLAMEDYHWWWRSFISGGATGLFVYAYSFFYFYFRSEMNGFIQTAFFFGYMTVVSYGIFLLLGVSSILLL